MPTLTSERIAEMTGGEVIAGGAVESTSVVIDSREARESSIFFAIRGERLDGHEFVSQALESAAGAVVSAVPSDYPASASIVRW